MFPESRRLGKTSGQREGMFGDKSYGFIDFPPSENPLSKIFKLTSRNFLGVTRSMDCLSFSGGKGNLGWAEAKPIRAMLVDWTDPISRATLSAENM